MAGNNECVKFAREIASSFLLLVYLGEKNKWKGKKKNGAFLLLLTRFKEGRRVNRSGEWRRRVREGDCTCRTRFLSDDKEQSKEEGEEEEDRRRFPARGHRTIIFPLPGGDIALFPSIECSPPHPLYLPLLITVIEGISQFFEIRKFVRNSSSPDSNLVDYPWWRRIRIFGSVISASGTR